jgi:hypothetical protein
MRLHLPRRRRAVVAIAVLSTATAMLTVLAPRATAADLDVSYTLEMCNLDKQGAVFDENDVTCNEAGYTTGNLGKGWSELDLVPARVTLDNNGATKTGQFVVAGDFHSSGGPATGWDFISGLTLDTANSDAICSSVTTGALQTAGTTSQIIYRTVTATVPAGATCLYDFYYRVALGAHLYPGSSMQANLLNSSLGTAGVGEKHISVNSSELLPQSIDKDMSATQGSDHVWDVTKEPTPATVDFPDTCDTSASRQAAFSVTVSWQKMAATASGPITAITHVYATNPASRTITVNVGDDIRTGTAVIDTASSGAIDVPANTTLLVLTHTTTVPSGTTNLNDVATATYTDTVTGLPVPGTTTATASATVANTGPELNQTATINDVESITGSGLSFSTDGFSGASGAFDDGYVAGTKTTGPVSWTSGSQSSSGSVTFDKTIYVDAGTSATGALSDTATVTGSDGFTTDTDLDVDLSASASVALTIDKTIPDILTGSETATFTFDVTGPGGYSSHPTISFAAGQTSKSTTLTGLAPGTYNVGEQDQTGWTHQSGQSADLSLPTCSGSVSFVNDVDPATARVRKDTVPDGAEAGWSFTLHGPNSLSETVTTTSDGYVAFASALGEGSYTITETAQSGWDQTSASSECSFTVNYPANAGHVYSCTYTNTARGSITVKKLTLPSTSTQAFAFTGDVAGTIGNNGTLTLSVAPGTYTSTEALLAGWDLTSISCTDSDSSGSTGTRQATFVVAAGENVTCTFTNRQRGHASVLKTVNGAAPVSGQAFDFQLRSGASATSAGTLLETLTATATNGGSINFTTDLVPGATYQLCEVVMPGWMTSLGPPFFAVYNPSGDNSTVCSDFTVAAGETKVFAIDNLAPPGGLARTIGFWKNWASCSGSKGKQKAVLDQTLAAAGGHILIGDLDVDQCLEAVRLLDKSRVDNGKKMASDPSFNLAAQLLAAKLNVAAGAGTCPAAVTAINSAQALLAGYDFVGTTAPKLSKSDATLANSLATTLDRYNNNTLC